MMKGTSQPLVSCIMPTYNRRGFVPHAIQYFLRQAYTPKELIIIDDGNDDVSDLVPKDDRIRYFRLGEKITLGAKLNMACEYARGTIVANWDDDDWYASHRLKCQVEALLHDRTDVCGINNLLYYDVRINRAYQYTYPADQRVWLLGSSLCYRKDLWVKNRFKEIDVGMDGLFVWAIPSERVTVLEDPTFSVFMIHEKNVSPKRTEGPWWHSCSVERICSIMGSDWSLYSNNNISRTSVQGYETYNVEDRHKEKLHSPVRNIFACLVHESLECVIDLIRNLRYHDPSSTILLYNGGKNSELLHNHFPFEKYGSVVYPSARPMTWGSLHFFALDCMQFALENFSFDTITIVDSDQLAVRSKYSQYLGQLFSRRTEVGMLGNSPDPQLHTSTVPAVVQALKEINLWRPFLKRFTNGEEQFVHWTFWPSTVFTEDLARNLTRFFAEDKQLREIMRDSQIWATEEVIIPTLVKLLGYKIEQNPCSYDYVKYRVSYSPRQIEVALKRQDVFWVHPVPRRYDDSLRKYIREGFNHYESPHKHSDTLPPSNKGSEQTFLLSVSILNAMKKVEGWLEEDEADLLISACSWALIELSEDNSIVEIGSYCGRSTVVLGSVVKAISPKAKVYAIDPHDGAIGALDRDFRKVTPTLTKFKSNITHANLTDVVETIPKKSFEVNWSKPINLLLIDGLHDYVNVARDFFCFEPWVVDRGYVIFHDYADYYPGVKAFVNETLGSGGYRKVQCVRSMIVLQKLKPLKEKAQKRVIESGLNGLLPKVLSCGFV